ncbi:MAG: alpha/beta hydrolase [Rhodobacteraceae bacterium]|nr:alpha/beta hydrolase [Paracoccaceae bacterium]
MHGYNNTTSDALLRMAQFVEDSGFQGVPVLFSWASAASLTRYVYDLNSALVARPKIGEISAIMARTNAEGYDVFAHSMGALLTMEAMRDQAQLGRLNNTGRLQTIILAAPDIDMDLFRSQLEQIDTKFDRFYVLLSEDDSA